MVSPPDFSVERDADLPVGTQLVWRLRDLIDSGRFAPGERLPSVRSMAAQAGVNVNTVRAVYRRLEERGLVRSEHGRGTFVAERPATQPTGDDERRFRRELQRQIAALEARLVHRAPPTPDSGEEEARRPRGGRARGGGLLTTDELAEIRDELIARLEDLETTRADLLRQIAELPAAAAGSGAAADAEAGESRQSSSRAGRVSLRWAGT